MPTSLYPGLPATDRANLETFYARVRPPGFWGRTAGEPAESRHAPARALGAALLTTAIGSLSLFLCMYGVVRLLVPMPGGGRLLAGVVLVPLWWRRTFPNDTASAPQ